MTLSSARPLPASSGRVLTALVAAPRRSPDCNRLGCNPAVLTREGHAQHNVVGCPVCFTSTAAAS